VGVTVFHAQHEKEYYYIRCLQFSCDYEWYEFVLLISHLKHASLRYWLRTPCS